MPEPPMRLRLHRVGGELVRELTSAGDRGLGADDLPRLRAHGRGADFVRHANARTGRRLSVDELVRLRSQGDR